MRRLRWHVRFVPEAFIRSHCMRIGWIRTRTKRARAAGMFPAARALRSDMMRRPASRGGTLRCAEAHALPTVMSISPTRPIDQANMAGREATSRQRCCRSRHHFRSRRTGTCNHRVMQLQTEFLRNEFGMATERSKPMSGGIASPGGHVATE
jgi:hypothetical protein